MEFTLTVEDDPQFSFLRRITGGEREIVFFPVTNNRNRFSLTDHRTFSIDHFQADIALATQLFGHNAEQIGFVFLNTNTAKAIIE